MERQNLKLTHGDKLLILLLVTLSVLSFVYNLTAEAEAGRKFIRVEIDGEQVGEYSFTEREERMISFRFGSNNEHKGQIEIKNGRVRMLPMGKELCPQGICTHTGWIEKSYETIVCLPNRIIVSFSEGSAEEEVDGVAY